MAYNEHLGERIKRVFDEKKLDYTSKKMFGGLCILILNKMVVGIVKEEMMARIGKDAYDEALTKGGVRKMDFTGREMKGYVFIDQDVIDMDSELEYWIDKSIEFHKTLIK